MLTNPEDAPDAEEIEKQTHTAKRISEERLKEIRSFLLPIKERRVVDSGLGYPDAFELVRVRQVFSRQLVVELLQYISYLRQLDFTATILFDIIKEEREVERRESTQNRVDAAYYKAQAEKNREEWMTEELEDARNDAEFWRGSSARWRKQYEDVVREMEIDATN